MRYVFLILLVMCLILPYSAHSATTNLADCAYATIDNFINHATPAGFAAEDTVTCPTGDWTWTEPLVITVPMTLIGTWNGSTGTTITANLDGAYLSANRYRAIIEYAVTSDESRAFRLSGFKIDMGSQGDQANAVNLGQSYDVRKNTGYVVSNVRVDHNYLTSSLADKDYLICPFGTVYGVIDSNVIDGAIVTGAGGSELAFLNQPQTFGSAYNLYIEDNVFNHNGKSVAIDGGDGSLYVARYNTLTNTTSVVSGFDAHGNMNGNMTTLVTETYGNNIINTGYNGNTVYHHGGKNLSFYNAYDGTGAGIYLAEFYVDSLRYYGTISAADVSSITFNSTNLLASSTADVETNQRIRIVNGDGIGQDADITTKDSSTKATINCEACATTPNWDVVPGIGDYALVYWSGTAKASYLQALNSSYYWQNRFVGTGAIITARNLSGGELSTDYYWNGSPTYANSPKIVLQNSSFWLDDSVNCAAGGVACSAGVGCGTLANRPVSCTTGVGYWATTQSCSDLTGMVGASPATPISGTLYKCTATDTWTAYYTPYTYPHPLRGPFSAQAAPCTPGAGCPSATLCNPGGGCPSVSLSQ